MGDIRRLSPPGLKDELPVNDDEQKNWKGILISLLVISTICSFIFLSIVLMTPHMDFTSKQEPLKIEDFILEGYESRDYNGSWISGKEILYKELNGSICIYNVETKHKEMILDGALTRQYEVQRFMVSHDHRYLLLGHDFKKTGTHTILGRFTIFDTKLHTFTPLRLNEQQNEIDMHQYADWVPDHSLIVLINRNNIYLLTPLGGVLHILTENGKDEIIYNGIPDIIYEEHVWKLNNGIWLKSYIGGWMMIYSTIDNTQVEQIPYIIYGKSSKNETQSYQSIYADKPTGYVMYPKLYSYPYSKPGKNIPRISLSVTKLNERNQIVYKNQPVTSPFDRTQLDFTDHYLSTGPVWISPYEFIGIWTRRTQEHAIIGKCREQTAEWQCEKLSEEKQLRPIGSLVLQSRPIISSSGDRIFLILPVSDGLAGMFDHIAQITMDGKKQFLTHGQYVVTSIYAYREDLQTLYYAANIVDEPGIRHIYSLRHHNNSNEQHYINCISCKVNATCLYNNARFSPDGKYFVLECLGPDYPSFYLIDTETEKIIEILDTNERLRRWSDKRAIPKIRQFAIKTSRPANYYIRIQLILPISVNELDDARYPLLIETNRMPGVQSVNYLNKIDWLRYLSSRREYITARIDTRGSGFQGDRHQYSIYKRIGELETEDLKIALAYLKQLPYVDHSKIAIWGQEYGGYLSTAFLATENSVACAVAVAPITSWKNYLSVFSERFMGTPEENYLGYEKSELMQLAPSLKGRTLNLVHGTMDRRVNIQHSMQFIKSLTMNAVQYRTQFYPDSGSLETWDLMIRYHFYRTMEDFFAKCFQVEADDDEDDLIPITKVIKGKFKNT
ncbi:inactive dipeptidyl peptidase 10 isoform X2 [Dermatophagoides farinae]|uniref:Dipeptidyl peptidase-like protein 1 n=2 Tax=Dermatophagoides farinae TaxID=6954 RepID=A0A9D4P9E6_DERFA|nr:dipeptidyl peptidase-like protein 1 [Dermatophagoides farinae]